MRRTLFHAGLALTILSFACGAWAGDGRLEINQICATDTGCFPGDAAGFPVTLDRDEPGSYVLTGNLTVPDASTTAIDVIDDFVTIDLNGFAIQGPTRCDYSGGCEPLGSGVGIRATYDPEDPQAPLISSVTVRNGTILGMGSDGVGVDGIDGASHIEGVRALHNGGSGIVLGTGGVVERSAAINNGSIGIVNRGVTTLSVARLNGFAGLYNNGIGLFIGNLSTNNGSYGLSGSILTDYFNNTLSNNGTSQVSFGLGLNIENSCNSSPCP